MTDAQYWTIANSLPKRTLNGIIIVDWRTAIAGCDPNIREACEFVLGFDPIARCWIDPGAQYANRPNPYPAASSWGVSICNAPVVTGGGGSGNGGSGGGGGGGGGTTTQCPAGTHLVGSSCVTDTVAPLPGLNMNYVLIGLGIVGVLMFMKK